MNRKNLLLLIAVLILNTTSLLAMEDSTEQPGAPAVEMQAQAAPVTVFVDPLAATVDARAQEERQRQIHAAVRERRTRKCLEYTCSPGPLFFIACVIATTVYFATKSSSSGSNNCLTATNDPAASCWQASIKNCGSCTSTEESDIFCAPPRNTTQAQLIQKITNDLGPLCTSKAQVCLKTAACPQICSTNYPSFKGYLNQKCKVKPQKFFKAQARAPFVKQKGCFKKGCR